MREDWIECKLRDLVQYSKGKKPSNLVNEKIDEEYKPYINIKAFEKGIVEEYSNDSKANHCVDGDLLMVWDGARAGLVGKAKNGLIGSTLMKIEPKKDVHKELIFYYLKSLFTTINTNTKGVGIPHVEPNLLWDSHLLFFTLPEQRAIVKKLESLFSSLDAGVADLKKAQQQLKIYRQAVLKKAFEGELTKEWREKQSSLTSKEDVLKVIKEKRNIYFEVKQRESELLNEKWAKEGKKNKRPAAIRQLKYFENDASSQGGFYLNEKIGNIYEVYIGSTPSRSNLDYWTNGSINWVSSGEVSFNRIKSTKEVISKIGYLNCSTTIHPKGTVMLAMIGEGKTRGQASILDIEACHNQNTAAIRQIDGLTKPEYLYYFLYYNYQKSRGIGSGNNQKALNQEVINNMIIPFCLLEEQNEIVKQIESRLSVCDSIEQNIKESLAKAEALRQSILKKAFEGNLLTAQELAECKKAADYEPANVLLERIKAEQNKATAKPSKKKVAQPLVVAKTETPVVKISADIHAGLIAKVIKIHEENPASIDNLSHIKCEKIAHLVEYHLQIPLGRQPVKDAAGPDDYPHLKNVESRAKKAGFFNIVKKPIGYSYSSANNSNKVIDKFQATLSDDKNKQLDDLIALFLKFDLEVSEIIATTYAGWNNLILNGNTNPSDEEIVYESRENWSERKLKIARERFFKAIEWMRKNEIIPTGYGAVVPFPKNKK